METRGGDAAFLDMVTKTSFRAQAGVFAAVATVTWQTDVTVEKTRRPQSLVIFTKAEHTVNGKKATTTTPARFMWTSVDKPLSFIIDNISYK